MLILRIILCLILVNVSTQNEKGIPSDQIHYLIPGKLEIVNCISSDVNVKVPSIYCYNGKKRELESLWETVSISVKLNKDLYEQFEGCSPDEVMERFKLHQSSWSANVFSFWKRKLINIDPFNKTCIGISTTKNYSISIMVQHVDKMQLLKFVMGIFLFFYARRLSQNQLFYYICGIVFGICGSVLILIYFISRIFPNKTLMYGFAASGWTLTAYFIQYLLDNAKIIALQHKEYVLGYIFISGLISFALCYRFGPLRNPRSKNLIQWSLQAVGLLLIYYSSHLYEITYMIDILLLTSRVLPLRLFGSIFSLFGFVKRKLFPPRIKLLTRKDYVKQGEIETKKALQELRGYCASPKCNPWKTVRKLKNPARFAEFMEGSPHLSDEEVENYGSLIIKPNGTIITDDSDSVADYSEED